MQAYESEFLFPLTKTKCPHCLDVTTFGLTEQYCYIIKVCGIGFGRISEYLLMCGGCGYKQFVQKHDLPKWRELGRMFGAMNAQTIPPEEYAAYVADFDVPELKSLFESAVMWNCSCGETNPLNFAVCWKCGAASASDPVPSEEKMIDTGEWQPWKL